MKVEDVPERERGPWINTDPERAVLVVYTDITGMKFATNNREIISVDSPQSGVFLVSLYPGTHIITFSIRGFRSVDHRVYIPPKNIREVRIKATSEGALGGQGGIRIETDPPSCYVVFNGIRLPEKTPVTLQDQPVGEHKLQLVGGFEWVPLDTSAMILRDTLITYYFNLTQRTLAHLKLFSDPPGAEVYLDDRKLGKTPVDRNDLVAGEYTIKLELTNYHNVSKPIRLIEGEVTVLAVQIPPKTGSVEITTTPPGADIQIDGKGMTVFEETPIIQDSLQVGEHSVLVSSEGYFDLEEHFRINYENTTSLDLTLRPKPGTIAVTSSPEGAKLFLNSRLTGELTPGVIDSVSVGKYRLKACLPGYYDMVHRSWLEAGGLDKVNLTFRAKDRSGAVWRSALLPGSGQRFAEHQTRGWIITAVQVAVLAFGVSSHLECLDRRDAYEDARAVYADAVTESELNRTHLKVTRAFDDWDSAARMTDLAAVSVSAVYLLNILDVAFLDGGRIRMTPLASINQTKMTER